MHHKNGIRQNVKAVCCRGRGAKSLEGIRSRPHPPKSSHDVRISGIWRKWKTSFRGPQRGLMMSKVINDGKD